MEGQLLMFHFSRENLAFFPRSFTVFIYLRPSRRLSHTIISSLISGGSIDRSYRRLQSKGEFRIARMYKGSFSQTVFRDPAMNVFWYWSSFLFHRCQMGRWKSARFEKPGRDLVLYKWRNLYLRCMYTRVRVMAIRRLPRRPEPRSVQTARCGKEGRRRKKLTIFAWNNQANRLIVRAAKYRDIRSIPPGIFDGRVHM